MFDTTQKNYQRLRSILKERTNPVVGWLGAGLSIPAGLPSWHDLKTKLCVALEEKISQIETQKDKEYLCSRLSYIRSESNLWLAFQNLKEALGDTSYVQSIRDAFSQADSCEIPDNYMKLLSLPLTGIITLNLDRLATRSFSKRNPGKIPVEFSGNKCGGFTYILKSPQPFILNLHGTVADKSSWIFTRKELECLTTEVGYTDFIKTVLCSRTVVFFGISADDVAIDSHLARLKKMSIDFGAHYWITDKKDAETDRWAEETGLLLIRYNPERNHSELSELLNDIANFVPEEQSAAPVVANIETTTKTDIPTTEELEKQSDEDVRMLLNEHAKLILKDGSPIAYANYEKFCSTYDRWIYRSWYVNTQPPSNVLVGYRIVKEIAEGGFGRVFEAESKKGERVALKLLKEDVRRKPEMLQSFRRGVQAMSILEKHKVKGMVPYKNSSEIPAFVAMDLVDGPNLKEAVEAGCCQDWSSILKIAVDLCSVIRDAHQLPERVLHRDIRPANIMLRNYYSDPDNFEVVVLDFDLSWYRGSQEVSVLNTTLNGFLAPEQVENFPGISTRNAAVDSFGIGMTLYFLRTGKAPIYMQHRHNDWETNLYETISSHDCKEWRSLPIRFARLIECATKDKQVERWDCAQILGELERLKIAVAYPLKISSAELVADELVYRTCKLLDHTEFYHWSPDKISGSLKLSSGVSIECIADETNQRIKLNFRWDNQGNNAHKNVGKYLKRNCEHTISQLTGVGWCLEDKLDLERSGAYFSLVIKLKQAASAISNITQVMAETIEKFRFN